MAKKSESKAADTAPIYMTQDILNYIEANLLESLTPKQIADQFYLSLSSLNILFRIVCGISVMEYIRLRRLSLAGAELASGNLSIINLALQYGYETPEAFSKAFTRFHGFPPSFVRRAYPQTKVFPPLQIKVEIRGGFEDIALSKELPLATKQNLSEQDSYPLHCYDRTMKYTGGIPMKKQQNKYHLHIKDMKQKEDWTVLLTLARELDRKNIPFKVDGKTMIFAHGLEFKLEKICLTFKWKDDQMVKDFFGYRSNSKESFKGFKFFDSTFQDMKIRCMFYGDCPGDDTDDFLFRNTESVNVDGQILPVQTLEFYYANAEPDSEYYGMVERHLMG